MTDQPQNPAPITHLNINQKLCGKVLEIRDKYCRIGLKLTEDMAVDDYHLVHGGFIFGLADYAAMITVNHPNVVLGSATVKFLKPAVVGDYLIAETKEIRNEGKKWFVDIIVTRNNEEIFAGQFTCFTPGTHVCEKN